MITVVQGRPGMGKSVFLVAEIMRWLKRGFNVYSNIEISFPDNSSLKDKFHLISSLEDIIKLREGKIILDEVQTYLNSRNWDKLDIRFQLLLQQHRKRGLDIIGATQSIKRADVVFRELVQVFYEIKKIITFKLFGKGFGFFFLREFDPDDTETSQSTKKPIGWPRPFFADPVLLELYDTTQEYKPQVMLGTRVLEEYVIAEKSVEIKQLVEKRTIT